MHRHAVLWELVRPLFQGADLGHDLQHVQRVYDQALRLAPEAGVEPDLAGAAAIVHDVVHVPKESADRPLGGELSAVAGRELLEQAGYDEADIAQVVEAVRTSSWSRGLAPTSPLGALLQDADRLDAIGAVGIARNVAVAQAMAARGAGSRLYDPADPAGRGDRELDDVRNAFDHFPRKLLRLAEGMHLPSAREEARRRHAFLVAFLDEITREVGSAEGAAPGYAAGR